MGYRANVRDRDQTNIETVAAQGGSPVFVDQKTRVVAKGTQTGGQRTQNSGTNLGRNAGVVLPHDDKPNSFPGDTIGKA